MLRCVMFIFFIFILFIFLIIIIIVNFKILTSIETEDQPEKKRNLLASAAEERLGRRVSLLDESEAEKRLSVATKESNNSTPEQHQENQNINPENDSHDDSHDNYSEKNENSSEQSECSTTSTNTSTATTSSTNDDQETTRQQRRDVVSIPTTFNRSPDCYEHVLRQLTPSASHSILFKPHLMANRAPLPYPDRYKDKWDKWHVRMPCSPDNLYPTRNKKVQNRWELIETTLLQTFSTSKDLEEAILVYNHHYKDKWNFEAWHSYCNIVLTPAEREDLFINTLPGIVNLALQLPNIVTQPPKLLQQGIDHTMTMSQKQIACLLANAFFCTFPRRNSLKSSEYCNYPDINFSRVFRGIHDVVNEVKTEKLKCILNYFQRVLSEMPTGTVSFHRKVLKEEDTPDWENCTAGLSDLYATSAGTIEEEGQGCLQVDFANRMIGGGVVGNGCVQEEIRFLMCPELIIARLFTEKLEANESLLVVGAERFNSYTGYASTFKHAGDRADFTQRDRWGRRHCEMIAIDAHVFHCYTDQFKKVSLERELNKAFSGFHEPHKNSTKTAVATGNWGCGAFGGDFYLKSLLQLMAASVAKRDVVYFTFKDDVLAERLTDMHAFLRANKITVGRLWSYLVKYGHDLRSKTDHVPLYPHLKELHEKYEALTDDETASLSSCNNDDNPLAIRGVPCEIPSDMSPLSPDYADTP